MKMEEKNNYKLLEEIWKRQRIFCKNFFPFDTMNDEDRQKATKEIVLHLIDECCELLRETKWKMHRQENINVSRNNIKEELVDIFKYWNTIMQIWNISPEEFLDDFNRKSLVVEQRFHQEKELKLINNENVIAVDIDGVLADYPKSFIKFIEKNTGKNLSHIKNVDYNLYDLLSDEIGYDTIRKLKHQYRETGEKRFIGVVEGAKEGMLKLKEFGFTIVLLSARPYKQYPRIFSDTIEWLKSNGFVYDAILWDEKKEEKIIQEFPKMKFIIEDNISCVNRVSREGYKSFLLDCTYNQGTTEKNVIRVKDWKEIIEILGSENGTR